MRPATESYAYRLAVADLRESGMGKRQAKDTARRVGASKSRTRRAHGRQTR